MCDPSQAPAFWARRAQGHTGARVASFCPVCVCGCGGGGGGGGGGHSLGVSRQRSSTRKMSPQSQKHKSREEKWRERGGQPGESGLRRSCLLLEGTMSFGNPALRCCASLTKLGMIAAAQRPSVCVLCSRACFHGHAAVLIFTRCQTYFQSPDSASGRDRVW